MAVPAVRPFRSRRAVIALVTAGAVVGAGLTTSLVAPASARDGDRATVPFRYAISAKKHGKKGTRLTRLVVRGLPADASLNITCFPAGTGGCPASGTIAPKASMADDGTQNFKIVTKGLGDFAVKSMISISGTAQGMDPHVVQLKVTKPGKFTEQPASR